MEENTDEQPENLLEAKVSKVVENITEEDIEIIKKTTNIVVHSESSHVESSYMSTQPISLENGQQISIASGESLKEEFGLRKVVRFDEKTEIVPPSDREESYESDTKEQSVDTEIQSEDCVEKIATEDTSDAKAVEFVTSEDVQKDEEVIGTISFEDKETELQVLKHGNTADSKLSVEILKTTEDVEEVKKTFENVVEESWSEKVEHAGEASKPEYDHKLDSASEDTHPEAEAIQEKPEESLEDQQPVSSSEKEFKSSTKEEDAQIQEEGIKAQLHDIINEIDNEVSKEDEITPRHHTWMPKGVYKMEKTEIRYEDVVPIKVDDVKIEDRPKSEPPNEIEKTELNKSMKVEIDHNTENYIQGEQSPHSKFLRHCLINGEVLSPTEIPIGIPLLAKILPRENEEDHGKIPLERLFTPASDWEEIIPQKKKAYASSCFYRPDHPTIDDQVELAHKISTSLVDETNKTSKGQNMYIKRKNRSAKWIHQAASQYDMEDHEETEVPQAKANQPLKLVVNPKVAQDYSQIQYHYEDLLSTSQTLQQISNMEVGKEIASDLQSPTGKGAALFAKRKKRMDKFIIDETTVQQQQQQHMQHLQQMNQQQQSFLHDEAKSSTTVGTTTTGNNYQTSAFESKFSSQTQNQMSSLRLQNEAAVTASSLTNTEHIQTGGLMLPDLTDILTKTKPLEKKTPLLAERGISKKNPASRSHSADSSKATSGFQNKLFLQSQPTKTKDMVANQRIHNGPVGQFYNVSSYAGSKLESTEQFSKEVSFQDPLENLRPCSPPTYVIPNGIESFSVHQIDNTTFQSINGTSSPMATSNNGIEKIANGALEHATNNATSVLHPLIANQAQSKDPSKLEKHPSTEPSKQDLKHACSLSHAFPITDRPEKGIKPERPNSLPVIPLANYSNPAPPSLYSASCNYIENANISQLEKTTLKGSLASQCSVNKSFVENQNFKNVEPDSIVNVLNEAVDPEEILMNPVSVLSKHVDKPESSLIEPSWSDMIVFLDPVQPSTTNNLCMIELSKLSSCNNNSSTNNSSSIISKGDVSPSFSPFRYASSNSFINFPKPFKLATLGYSPAIGALQTHISPSLKNIENFKTKNTFTASQTFNLDKLAEQTKFKNNKMLMSNDDRLIDELPGTLEESNFGFNKVQRSSSAVHKTDDLRQIIEELDSMIELDAKLHNNFFDKPECDNENNANLNDEVDKFFDSSLCSEVGITVQRTDSLVNDDELDNFISEIERSFSTTPTILETISIQDLQPPEFYRSVSRNSINDDVEVDTSNEPINDQSDKLCIEVNNSDVNKNYETFSNHEMEVMSSAANSKQNTDSTFEHHANNTQHTEFHLVQNKDDPLLVTNALHKIPLSPPVVSDNSHVCNQATNTILTATQTEGSIRHSDINISPWSTECGAIYTAEVKVIQTLSPVPMSSFISFSAPVPQHSILSDLASVHEKDKRKSFNLAPKGWGTYNTYYTPVHLGAP